MYFHMLQQKEKKKLYLAVFSRETAPRECVYVCVYLSLYLSIICLSVCPPTYLPISLSGGGDRGKISIWLVQLWGCQVKVKVP